MKLAALLGLHLFDRERYQYDQGETDIGPNENTYTIDESYCLRAISNEINDALLVDTNSNYAQLFATAHGSARVAAELRKFAACGTP